MQITVSRRYAYERSIETCPEYLAPISVSERYGSVHKRIQITTFATAPTTSTLFPFDDDESWISVQQAFKIATDGVELSLVRLSFLQTTAKLLQMVFAMVQQVLLVMDLSKK